MANEVSKPVTKNDLISVSMKNYLSSPNIDAMVDGILHEKKGAFIATVTSLVNGSDKLAACDKSTILMACLKAIGMNLPIEPALGQAYIIPYGSVAQFQLGYRGLVQLALRTSQYEMIGAREVKEGEFKGYNMVGDPIIMWDDPDVRFNKKTTGYMAGFQLMTGFKKTSYWTIAEVDKHANTFSQAYKNFKKYGASQSTAKSGNMTNPWESNFGDMAQKTVLKNVLSKYGVLSIELKMALKYDQSVISIDEQGNEDVKFIDNPSIAESSSIGKDKQDLLLKSYDAALLKEALYKFGVEDITQLTEENFDDFVKVCLAVNAEYKQVELK